MPETPPKDSEWEEDQQVFPLTPQKPHIPTITFEHLDSEYDVTSITWKDFPALC